MKYQYKKHDIKQKEFSRYLKRIRIVNKSEKQKKKYWLILMSFLTKETMLLNL